MAYEGVCLGLTHDITCKLYQTCLTKIRDLRSPQLGRGVKTEPLHTPTQGEKNLKEYGGRYEEVFKIRDQTGRGNTDKKPTSLNVQQPYFLCAQVTKYVTFSHRRTLWAKVTWG